MSDRLGLKIKENAGKTKYSSLNLNQTYKGTKVETKTSTGPARHGLQSLGKIGSTRRVPPPANLPSLKSENSGNDPTVSLVPSGGGGWGSTKEKVQETPSVTPASSVPSSTTSQQNAPSIQQPQLQPQRPSATPSCAQPVPQVQQQTQQGQQQQSQNTGQSQTQQNKHEGQTKTWGNVSSSGVGGQGKTYSHQPSPYFSREFPALNGGSSGEHPPEEKEPSYGPPPVIHNTHEPSWMERSGPAPPPPDHGFARDRDRGAYNGPLGQHYRRPQHEQEHGYNRGYPGHPHHFTNGPHYPHPYGPPHGHSAGGRHPPHGYPPENYRGGPFRTAVPPRFSNERGGDKDDEQGEGYGRPSIVKAEDIQALDDDEDDGGWAGAQEEVDYTAKLNFEDFDDEDSGSTKANQKEGEIDAWHEEKDNMQEKIGSQTKTLPSEPGATVARTQQIDVKKGPRTAWADPGMGARQPPYRTDSQAQPQVGKRPYDKRGYPPGWQERQPQIPAQYPSGSGATSVGKPLPDTSESKPVNEFEFRRQKQQNEMHQAVERARKRREEDEASRLAKQKAAAHEKLKELDEKCAHRRESESSSGGDHAELPFIEEGGEKRVYEEKDKAIEGSPKESNFTHDWEVRLRESEARVRQSDSSLRDSDSKLEESIGRHPDLNLRSKGLDVKSTELASRGKQLDQGSRVLHQVEHKHDVESDDVFLKDQGERNFALQRSRHDSESSDRSSGSRQSYHPPQKSMPPRFQQRQQHISSYQQKQQEQQYKKTVGLHQQQFFDKPPPPASSVDTGLQLPIQPTKVGPRGMETVQPVRRIMKRSDSSSTAGDDNASVKSVDSAGERDKKYNSDSRGPPSARTLYDPKAKPERRDPTLEGKGKRPNQQFEETNVPVAEDSKEKHQETEKLDQKANITIHKGKNDDGVIKEQKNTFKGEISQHKEKRASSSATVSRKRDPGSRDRKVSGEVSKRRRDDDNGERYDERDRYSGRVGEVRKGVSYPVGSRGRGRGFGPHRGRGRGDSRWSHSRDSRDTRTYRSRDNKDVKDMDNTDGRHFKYRDIRISEEQVPKEQKEKGIQNVKDENNSQNCSNVKQNTVDYEKQIQVEEPNEVSAQTNESEKNQVVSRDSTGAKLAKQEPRKIRDDSERLRASTDRFAEKQEDRKRNETSIEGKEEQATKGRGGFDKPPPKRDSNYSSQDYSDTKYRNREKQRESYKGHGEDKDQRYPNEEHYGRGRGRRGRGGREDNRRGRDLRLDNRSDGRYNRDRYDRYDREDRDKRNLSYSTRGGRGGRGITRGGRRGGLSRDVRRIGSGRVAENTHTKTRKDSETVGHSDDDGSDTSSYTTATSASDEKVENEQTQKSLPVEETADYKEKEQYQAKSGPRAPTKALKTSTTRGAFNKTRKETERPPRFQKQREERVGLGRGRLRGTVRDGVAGRGRGRGRSRTTGEREGVVIPSTEDWDDDVKTDVTVDKKTTKQREERKDKKENNFRRSGGERMSGRQASLRTQENEQSRERRPYQHRDGFESKGTYRKGESFLAERQQAKSDGSLSATRESLPAAKQSTLNTDKRAPKKTELKSEKNNAYNTVDSIGTSGSEPTKAPKKSEAQPKTLNIIDKYDLHNIAGVICIDDMTDDDSDISSTLSGFVEVTSRRALKEQKDRQREEEEKRRRVEEKAEHARQKGNQIADGKFKKNQPSKPPRFAKQHPAVAPSQLHSSAKSVGNLGKLAAEIVQPPSSTGASSNASSTNSTKRNSPITVERGISPAPPPIFNAWDRPLIVTPAKQPSVSAVVNVVTAPDPLAVGSGKPSSSRTLAKVTHVPPVHSSLTYEEKLAVDDELLEITKEIESMAPVDDSEEIEKDNRLSKKASDSKDDNKENQVPSQDQAKQKKTVEVADKKGHPKPQREKAPRFERTKRKAVEDPKKELTSTEKCNQPRKDGDESAPTPAKRPNSRNEEESVKSPSKTVLHSRGSRQQRGSSSSRSHKPLLKMSTASKEPNADANLDKKTRDASEQDIKSVDLQEATAVENEKVEGESKTSSRKSSDPDFSVDRTSEGVDDSDNLFNSAPLDVNLATSSAETPEREQAVSPAIFELGKKMVAAKLAWHHVGGSESITASVTSAVDNIENRKSTEVSVSSLDSRENPEVITSTADVSKTSESQTTFTKKPTTGEQQNVCKVKPQQQQPSKPQPSATMISHISEENTTPKVESVQLQQNLLPQDQYLHQPFQYPFPLDPQFVRLSQRQPQHAFIQQQRQAQPFLQQQQQPPPMQQMQQSTQQPNYQIVQQIRQPQSTPSPLSQPVSDVYQSFMQGSLYSANTFQAPQSVVPVPILTSSTTQTFGTNTKTQSSALNFQPQQQQAKPAAAPIFTPNVTPSPTQTVYMPFEASGISGGATVFGINQQPQAAQRQILSSQPSLLSDAISFGQQGNLQLTQQAMQRATSYPQRRPFETANQNQASQMPKAVDQPGRELTQSELAKHIHAKPFEPPKRLSTPISSVTPPSSSPGMNSLMTSGGMINASIIAVPPSPPTLSSLSQSPPVSTTFVTSRNMSVSPVAPATNLSFTQGIGSLQKQSPVGQFQLQQQPPQQPQQFTPFQQHSVHIQPTLHQPQIRPQLAQQPAHQANYPPRVQTNTAPAVTNQVIASVPKQFVRNPGAVGNMQQGQPLGQRFQGPCIPHAQQFGQRFPGPIQRPPVSVAMQNIIHGHPRPSQPARPPRLNSSSRPPVPKSAPAGTGMMQAPPQHQALSQQVFRNQQHQKMLEETKRFFAQQSQGSAPTNPLQQSLQPSSTEQPRMKPVALASQPASKPNKLENKQQLTNFKPDKKIEETNLGTTDPVSKNKKLMETSSKVLPTVKPDSSKPEPTSGQEKGGSKPDVKGPQAKRVNTVRPPQGLSPRFSSGISRGKPIRGRGTRNVIGSYQPVKPTTKPTETTQLRVEPASSTVKESAQDTSPQKASNQANTYGALTSAS